jgi:hypothetical protein
MKGQAGKTPRLSISDTRQEKTPANYRLLVEAFLFYFLFPSIPHISEF